MNEIPPQEQAHYTTFRECLSEQVISALASTPDKKRRRAKRGNSIGNSAKDEKADDQDEGGGDDVEELADFVEVRLSNTTGKE